MAGFKNAIRARRAPTPEEDPDFSLLDARHSVIRHVPSTVRSANSGGDVVDPRSGEVIRAHTNVYHGLDERLRWWLVSQVATANPRFRTSRLSEEDMGEAIRYVLSHETAHSVGLPHNQMTNFAFPVDSIRDPDFVERWGHSASSVGRTRYNYVAQPGDGVPPERRIGMWDKFTVMWGYRPIPEAATAREELDTLNEWIVERADPPRFRSATAQFGMDVEWDPRRMTEGVTDDPVRAAEYGMRNLRTAIESLLELAVQRLLNHALQARMIEHEAFHGNETHRPAEMLDDAREMVWREVGQGAAIDTYRRNVQWAYLEQARHLLHEAESDH